MLVLGGGVPLAFAAMAKLIVDAVRPIETGVASGMNTVMRTIGGVVGGQVGAAILTANTIGEHGRADRVGVHGRLLDLRGGRLRRRADRAPRNALAVVVTGPRGC